MPDVNISAVYPDGTPLAHRRMWVSLVDAGAGGSTGDETLVLDTRQLTLDENGQATVALPANSSISPAGTRYVLRFDGVQPPFARAIEVPDGAGPYDWADPELQVDAASPAAPTLVRSDATPTPVGTAAAGTASTVSRADHGHALPAVIDAGSASAAPVAVKDRRDTAAGWVSAGPTLPAGVRAVETDTGLEKLGDGTSAWSALPYMGELGSWTPMTPPSGWANLNSFSAEPYASWGLKRNRDGSVAIRGVIYTAGDTLTLEDGNDGNDGSVAFTSVVPAGFRPSTTHAQFVINARVIESFSTFDNVLLPVEGRVEPSGTIRLFFSTRHVDGTSLPAYLAGLTTGDNLFVVGFSGAYFPD